MKRKKLRAYFVDGDWDRGCGFGIIARSAKEAKKIAYGMDGLDMNDWIELHVKWVRDANIDGLKSGHVFSTNEEAIDAMFRRVYGSGLEHVKCPNCGTEDTYVFELYENVFGCDNCEDKLTEKDINNPYVLREENIALKSRLKELEKEKELLIA